MCLRCGRPVPRAAKGAVTLMAMAGPTYAEVSKRLQLAEKRAHARATVITAWRARHPEASCSDAAALALAEMEGYRQRRSA